VKDLSHQSRKGEDVERAPRENRFEFVVVAGKRARQLLAGALPREEGEKKITIAQREVLRRKVEKIPNEEA
jgi:DNA-directed RNA polymerase omega subunit